MRQINQIITNALHLQMLKMHVKMSFREKKSARFVYVEIRSTNTTIDRQYSVNDQSQCIRK